MTVIIASEMHFNAFQCIAQPNTTFAWMHTYRYTVSDTNTIPLWSRHFTKLCKSVYPWERVSEIQSIKETSKVHQSAGLFFKHGLRSIMRLGQSELLDGVSYLFAGTIILLLLYDCVLQGLVTYLLQDLKEQTAGAKHHVHRYMLTLQCPNL